MALETKIDFIEQDKSGRKVVVKDGTGFESAGRESGYGPGNGLPENILAYYFVVSRIFSRRDYTLKIDGTDPNLPTPTDLAYGQELELNTALFKYEDGDTLVHPMQIFCDGVLDLNMYVEFVGQSGVSIQKDTNFITGSNFSEAVKGDAVLVAGKIYQIDKSSYNNGSTVLYIIGAFEDSASSYNYLYRANVKVLLTAMSENLHSYACKLLSSNVENPDWNKINTAISFRRAALGFFNAGTPDYVEADDLIQCSFKILEKYTI